jgi:hypothetical protein
MDRTHEPDTFDLASEDGQISIHFESLGFVQPQLTYHDKNSSQGEQTFGPNDIEVVSSSPLGKIVTVTLSFAFDGDMHNLNLLLPEVRLTSESADVHTVAIRTVNRGSIAPQTLEGQIQLYQPFELNGTASRRGSASQGEAPPESLFRHWVRSHEEDTGDIQVFRPKGFDFPPARGRPELEIRQDGTVTAHQIGPGDGLEPVRGKWVATSASTLEISLDSGEKSTIVIDSVADDVLKVRKAAARAGRAS